MSKSTISTFDLFQMFPDQESARAYFEARRWPNGANCPACGEAKRIGTRNTILIGIATYVLVCVIALGLTNLAGFMVLGALVGTAQGGVQALSRSFFGKLIPADRSGEFFGFFDIFGKFSAVIGPFLFGLLIQLTGIQHTGIIPVLVMFIAGGLLLWFAVPNDAKRFADTNESTGG